MKTEFQTLKDQAKLLGINVSPNMKETEENTAILRERVKKALEGDSDNAVETDTVVDRRNESVNVSERKQRMAKHKEAMKLRRVIIRSNNFNKKDYIGEIITVANGVGVQYKKMVPFNVKTHIPQIMYTMLKEKQYQQFYKVKDAKGRDIPKRKFTNEYVIEDLPPIPLKEYEAIRQRQLLDDGSE